jgi:hypothetical protein
MTTLASISARAPISSSPRQAPGRRRTVAWAEGAIARFRAACQSTGVPIDGGSG